MVLYRIYLNNKHRLSGRLYIGNFLIIRIIAEGNVFWKPVSVQSNRFINIFLLENASIVFYEYFNIFVIACQSSC